MIIRWQLRKQSMQQILEPTTRQAEWTEILSLQGKKHVDLYNWDQKEPYSLGH